MNKVPAIGDEVFIRESIYGHEGLVGRVTEHYNTTLIGLTVDAAQQPQAVANDHGAREGWAYYLNEIEQL